MYLDSGRVCLPAALELEVILDNLARRKDYLSKSIGGDDTRRPPLAALTSHVVKRILCQFVFALWLFGIAGECLFSLLRQASILSNIKCLVILRRLMW